MITINLDELAFAVQGTAYAINARSIVPALENDLNGIPVLSVSTDSRECGKGCVFIALQGEKVDGHSFIPRAAEAGGIAAIVEKRYLDSVGNIPDGFILIAVESTYAAVGMAGAFIREKSGVTVVGITGSVGKTSVKEMTASVLRRQFSVLKTEGNFNNELGLPRTLFKLSNKNQVAVLEMGISHFGEMSRLSSIARPDYAIFTNIENVHTEHLTDRDGVLRAKMELVENMRGNILVLNGDDDKLRSYTLPKGMERVYYGFSAGCDVTAEDIVADRLTHTSFTLRASGERISVDMPAPGLHMVRNALAAASVGVKMGLSLPVIKEGIEAFTTVSGRMNTILLRDSVILDDCYNASPASAKASLGVLALARGRKIALLGDMLELGRDSEQLHYGVGKVAAELGIDMLITVGELSKFIAQGANKYGLEKVIVTDKTGATEFLRKEISAGDTLLVKASRGMKLETVIKGLMSE